MYEMLARWRKILAKLSLTKCVCGGGGGGVLTDWLVCNNIPATAWKARFIAGIILLLATSACVTWWTTTQTVASSFQQLHRVPSDVKIRPTSEETVVWYTVWSEPAQILTQVKVRNMYKTCMIYHGQDRNFRRTFPGRIASSGFSLSLNTYGGLGASSHRRSRQPLRWMGTNGAISSAILVDRLIQS